MFKRILVATDGSTLSKKAVTTAIALAAQHDADLVALDAESAIHHVWMGGVSHVVAGEPVRRGMFER